MTPSSTHLDAGQGISLFYFHSRPCENKIQMNPDHVTKHHPCFLLEVRRSASSTRSAPQISQM